MSKTVETIGLAIACGVISIPAAAQQPDTTRLADLTVTATRVPLAQRDLAVTLSTLDGDDLRARGVLTVADALREVPGATVIRTGSYGGITSLFLRGGESDYVKVLIDGVPVNQPGGAFDFAHLSTENVARIEILRGPASVLYGSEATTGVVQIITRDGSGPPRATAQIGGGSYGSARFNADVVGGTGTLGYSVGVGHFLTDGIYDFNSDYDNTVVSGRARLRPDSRTDLAFSVRYRDAKLHFPTDGAGNVVDRNAFNTEEVATLGFEAGRHVSDRVELRMTLAANTVMARSDDRADGPADTVGFFAFASEQDLDRQSADIRANVYVVPGVVLTAGGQYERQSESTASNSDSQFGPSEDASANDRDDVAGYLQLIGTAGSWSTQIGARVDRNDEFGTFGTYRAALSYRLPSATKVRVSAGRSFKAPTFFENYATGFATGNPDLRPERASTIELGIEQRAFDGRFTATATAFVQRFRDMIQFTFDTSPNFANVAEADAAGLELEAAGQPTAAVGVFGNLTYLHTEVVDAGFDSGEGAAFVDGQRLLRRPTVTANVGVDVAVVQRGRLSARLAYVGPRDDRDFGGFPAMPVELAAYATLDLAGSFDLFAPHGARPGFTAAFRVENAFDELHEDVFGFPDKGRTLFVTARLSR